MNPTKGVRLCTLGCMDDCQHGVACEAGFAGSEHPVDRGHLHHFGISWEHDEQVWHEWRGAKGKCRMSEWDETETPSD